MDCAFCNIATHEKERTLREAEHVFAVLSNPRLMPGHTLVVPKRHVLKVAELSDQERKELFEMLVILEEKILSSFASGCDIRQHYRPFIAQDGYYKMNHLHFHLHPREHEDELYHAGQKFERTLFKDLPDDEREKFMKLLA